MKQQEVPSASSNPNGADLKFHVEQLVHYLSLMNAQNAQGAINPKLDAKTLQ